MRKIFTILVAGLLVATVWAQAPQKMSYQKVIRDADGLLVTNQVIGMEINIRQSPQTGTVVYTETQTPTTNDNGLINIEIGGGASFNTINWAIDNYYIETKIALVEPLTTYTITGTSQLLSVPYALHAKSAEIFTGTIPDVEALLARIEALEESDVVNNCFTDTRDGNHYHVVKIGNQVWMAENLKYLPGVAGLATGSQTDPYYYIYGYDGTVVADAKATANYATCGVLYNWPATMADSARSGSNPSGVQGVCPSGWHVPSDAEWTTLTTYLGGESVSGDKLKETGTTHWSSPNTGATNETGFTALPGGHLSSTGAFFSIGNTGYRWCATEYSTISAYYWRMGYDYSDVNRLSLGK